LLLFFFFFFCFFFFFFLWVQSSCSFEEVLGLQIWMEKGKKMRPTQTGLANL